jgi:hypothetical protein
MNQLKDKKCKNCGNKFTPFTTLQQVCSKKCELEYKKSKQKNKSKAFPPKRTSIAPMSKKAKAEHAIYMPIRNEYMKEHPVCECCNQGPSNEIHHIMGRVGYANKDARLRGIKLLWDKKHFLAVCRSCHNEIHFGSPEWARKKGYIKKPKG